MAHALKHCLQIVIFGSYFYPLFQTANQLLLNMAPKMHQSYSKHILAILYSRIQECTTSRVSDQDPFWPWSWSTGPPHPVDQTRPVDWDSM